MIAVITVHHGGIHARYAVPVAQAGDLVQRYVPDATRLLVNPESAVVTVEFVLEWDDEVEE